MHRPLLLKARLPRPPRRVGMLIAVWLCLVALLLLLAACGGPGVGGTGTGATVDPLPAFGAKPSALCDSELAARLQCPSGAGGAAPVAGTAAVGYGEGLAAAPSVPPALARFEGNGIDFQLPCQALRFIGQWGQLQGQSPRFYGVLDQAGTPSLASLTVQVQGSQLLLQLQDTQGQALADARTLSRLPIAPPADAIACR